MRVLIVNDDGINAEGIRILAGWVSKWADVTVVAPKVEQSGKSHSIEIHKPFEVKRVESEHGFLSYSVDSTPADCVRFAVRGLHMDFDLVLSGINRGYNVGCDVMYSGTAGAAFEAAVLGIPAVALSTSSKTFEGIVPKLDKIKDFFISNRLLERHSLYNVNIPPEGDRIRFTCQGGRLYYDEFHPVGEDMYIPRAESVYKKGDNLDIDVDAVHNRCISISPMNALNTDLALYEELRGLNEN